MPRRGGQGGRRRHGSFRMVRRVVVRVTVVFGIGGLGLDRLGLRFDFRFRVVRILAEDDRDDIVELVDLAVDFLWRERRVVGPQQPDHRLARVDEHTFPTVEIRRVEMRYGATQDRLKLTHVPRDDRKRVNERLIGDAEGKTSAALRLSIVPVGSVPIPSSGT